MRVPLGTVAAMATAAVAVASVAYAHGRRSQGRVRNPAPGTAREPAGGYIERWRQRRAQALAHCRSDPEVTTLPQALACAFGVTYPEAKDAPPVGWVAEARSLIEQDLLSAASRDGGAARPWEMGLWLQGPSALLQCGGRARCAAQRIFPGADWQRPSAPWQWQLLAELERIGGGR